MLIELFNLQELRTCDPSYYKHTQRLFLMMFEAGLAYQKEAFVNWDPIDKTVLANEQVDANGCSWRSGAKVEQRDLKQWFLAITKFAPDLLSGLNILEKDNSWPSRVIDMQRNWLGKSEGVEFELDVWATQGLEPTGGNEQRAGTVKLFTTRLDTLHGAQFVALSLKHPLVQVHAAKNAELRDFLKAAQDLPPDSKEGFLLPRLQVKSEALNHLGSSVSISLPVYAAPYVLDNYGTGAVMGVPAHDTRDFAFWKLHNSLKPVKFVVAPKFEYPGWMDKPFVEKGTMIHGFQQGNLHSDEAVPHIAKSLQEAGHNVAYKSSWRLRDWLISRQRYWGAPIPIIHCSSCGAVPVPAENLPVELPKLSPDQFHGRTGNPLEKMDKWVNTTCPKCSGPAKRDTDTMDTFMDSAWYFFRFADPKNEKLPFDPAIVAKALPVDFYIGGVEHAILHLLYARFIAKFLASPSGKETWKIAPDIIAEPFKKLVAQGMVHGKTYTDPSTGRFLKPDEVDLSNPAKPKMVGSGVTPNISFEKMSKSKYNGVDPASCINKYGADVTRAHMLFAAPESEVLEWEEERITGITRWLSKLWRVVDRAARLEIDMRHKLEEQTSLNEQEQTILQTTKMTVESVTAKLKAASGLNTVVSDLIKLTNAFDEAANAGLQPRTLRYCTEVLVKMVAPLVPAFAEEAWHALHPNEVPTSITEDEWPDLSWFNEEFALKTQTCVLTINGKRKFDAQVPLPPEGMEQGEVGEWLKKQLLGETAKGKGWASYPQNQAILDSIERIVVGKNGGLLNLVLKKEKKKGKE
jgi:leucyl-tRNA synthetase